MKTKILFSVLALFLMISASSQKPTLELTFTAIDSAAYVQLESIKVKNRSQLFVDTVLYWPDTVLTIYNVGIPEINNDVGTLKVFQNYPNPVADQTTISMYVPEKDEVGMILTDILGRVILKSERVLEQGTHSFRFNPGCGNLYFFTAKWRGKSSSLKILQAASHSYGQSSLEYIGSEASYQQLKATLDIQSFTFSFGNRLLYIGYANGLQSGMLDTPEESETYTFQFATNIPCPGTPTVEYEGQVYNTIQIFSQCWLKENLNVGTMIPGNQEMTDNGIMEKYCYDNELDSCAKYGGLYQWNEMMQYTTLQGTQGICPVGWHLPTDDEWKILEGAVDSQYGIGDSEWELWWILRGYDAGTNLKTTSGWNEGGNGTDLFGFSGMPGGRRWRLHLYWYDIGDKGSWWTSTQYHNDSAWSHILYYCYPGVELHDYKKGDGFSVRCVRDE